MPMEHAIDEAAEAMDRAVAHTRGDFATVRTGRASPALVEKLRVEYYGSEVPLQQLAAITVPEPRQLLVAPYDKGALAAVEKAILASDLGINPSNDGQVIRLAFPQLTAERRRELVKVVRHKAEEGRVSVRGHRRHARQALEALESTGEISADQLDRAEKELEGLTQDHVSEIDELLARKEQELLEV